MTTGFLKKVPLLAAVALLQFDTYLRPDETLALEKGHVLSPVRNAGVAYRRPATELSTTKSGSQDDTLFVGDAGGLWAVSLLRTLHARCTAPRILFSATYSCDDMNKVP